MFQRIIVPLDGSRRAERAIPVAAPLARASQGSIVFLRVVVPRHDVGFYGAEPAVGVLPSQLESTIAEADQYLSSVATMFRDYLTGIKIETEVETGSVASTILSTVRFEHGDLIVLCSHGETGLKRWVLRSIALQAVRHSPVPVLILNERDTVRPLEEPTHPLHVLVPLDGSMLAETALPPVLQLVAALSPKGKEGTLHLLRVIDVPSRSGTMRGQTRIDTLLREHERQEAQKYLDAVVKRLQEEAEGTIHLSFTTLVIIRPDVPGTILQEAEKGQCDLIALATHGRSGLMRALMGSVTERVVGHTTLPLLVTRPLKPIVEPEKIEDVRDDEQILSSWVGLL